MKATIVFRPGESMDKVSMDLAHLIKITPPSERYLCWRFQGTDGATLYVNAASVLTVLEGADEQA